MKFTQTAHYQLEMIECDLLGASIYRGKTLNTKILEYQTFIDIDVDRSIAFWILCKTTSVFPFRQLKLSKRRQNLQ